MLLIQEEKAAEALGRVLLWREDVRIVEAEDREDAAKYILAFKQGEMWRLYTLRFRKRGDKREGELNTPAAEAEEAAGRLAALLKELSRGTPYEQQAEQYQPRLGRGARTQRIYVGGWARELLRSLRGKNL